MTTNVNWIKSWHYYRRYLKLINHYKLNLPEDDVYTENHHILPKSMGGSNNKINLVKLTPRAHYLAHYMLWKTYGNREMAFAFNCMNTASKSGKCHVRYLNSKIYEKFKLERKQFYKHSPEIIKLLSDMKMGKNNPNFGKKQTEESNRKRRLSCINAGCGKSSKGRIPWNKGKSGCQVSWNKGKKMNKTFIDNVKLGKSRTKIIPWNKGLKCPPTKKQLEQ